ncbi:MAG TPA: DUF87 domain-containing protein, partial [Coleofasciculaceae cyanobacterium]
MINTFIALAFVLSLAGSVAAPTAAVLFKSYKEERRRIEAGYEPTYLNYTSELYEPPQHKSPVVEEPVKKHLGLPLALQPGSPDSDNWINHFISQTALIWGNQGSGKSWMARVLAKRKKDKGYRVVVLDPDSNRVEWEGVESYHDFDEIADFLRWYVDELKSRYKLFNASNMTEDAWRAKLWADGKALALICEEVTTYTDLIEDKELLTQFFRLGLTKSRKQEMPLTFVSHNN